MAWNCCSTDAKCLIRFSHTLTRILINNWLKLFVVKTACSSSSFFIIKVLSSRLGTFLKHLHNARSHLNPIPHALLILVEVSETLCSSLNPCNMIKRRSCFGIFIIEGFLSFKNIFILKKITNNYWASITYYIN